MTNMKIFGIYDIGEVGIEDVALKRYINLQPRIVIKSQGRYTERFAKIKVNIVERLINNLQVPGHRGKKHKIVTGRATGKFTKKENSVKEALKIIEQKTNQNPIQILVKAIENAAPRDEVTSIEYGGARYPQAVDCAPMRRLNLALKNIVHGAYEKSFRKKKTIGEALAEEILATYEKKPDSFSLSKKNETEKQADAAR